MSGSRFRSSSIGSPLLNAIRRGASRSSARGCIAGLTQAASAAVSALAPRVYAAHIQQLFSSDVTVRVFSCQETSGACLVQTMCSIWDGRPPLRKVSECLRVMDSRLFPMFDPEIVGQFGAVIHPRDLSMLLDQFPMRAHGTARDYCVWISPVHFPREAMRKHGR